MPSSHIATVRMKMTAFFIYGSLLLPKESDSLEGVGLLTHRSFRSFGIRLCRNFSYRQEPLTFLVEVLLYPVSFL